MKYDAEKKELRILSLLICSLLILVTIFLAKQGCGQLVDNYFTDISTLWNGATQIIKSSITIQAFSTWIEPIRPIKMKDSTVVLEVPNQFYYEWINSHYNPLLKEALRKISNVDFTIEYKVVVSQPEKEKKYAEQEEERKRDYNSSTKLNQRYTFDNFVEGSSNQLAKAAAISVSESPGQTSFNPLMIYGGVGLGKTHLLQAIGNHVLSVDFDRRIRYTTSEKFTLEFISSIQSGQTAEFSSKHRNCDVLLVDDIQFLQKKEQTQEQFFHTFNELYQQGKQIVLTSDRHHSELYGLHERLISRFQSGLVVDIQPPNLETRIAILQRKAEEDGLDIPFEIIEVIASKIRNNIREMEGALIKLLAYSSLTKSDITMDLVRKALNESLGKNAYYNISLGDVINGVSSAMNIPEEKIVGKGRTMEVANARQIGMYLCRELVSASLTNIGLHFGGKDHTTVMHACKTVDKKMKEDQNFSKIVQNIHNQILAGA